jgi:hypothetical protein
MAKIADLLVQLTVDTASFRRDFETARKDVAAFGQGITGTFSQLQRIATTGLQAFGVAMAVDFVKSTTAGIDALGKLSQKIGISVEDLSQLQHAAAVSDVPIETFATGIGLLSKAINGFTNDENKGASGALQNLGIAAKDANGNIRPTSQVLADVADKFAGMEDGAQKTALAMLLFGRSGKELIPLLNGGSLGIREMNDEAKALGLQLDEKTAKAAERFHDNLTRLESASKGLSQTLVSELLPSLNRITDGLVEAAKTSDNFSSIKAIGKTLDLILATFSSIVTVLRIAIDYVGKFYGALGAAVQLIAKGDFAGLKELDHRLKQELLDPFKDAGVELRGIWQTALGGIADDTQSAVSLVQKRLNAIQFGIKNGLSQTSGGSNKEANAVKAAKDEYAQTVRQLEQIAQEFGDKRIQVEQLVAEAAKLRDAKIYDATKESTEKRIAEAKRYAAAVEAALDKVNRVSDTFINKSLDPFEKINQDYVNAIDELASTWAKYPETRELIEKKILAIVKSYDAQIIQEEQKALEEVGKLIAKALQEKGPDLKSVPIITPVVKPKLDTSDLGQFYSQAVQQLAKFGTDAEKELAKITAVDRIKQSVDELILRTGTAAGGARVFFRQYAQYANDTAQVVHDAFAKIFSALEDQLTNLLAHFKFDFKSLLDTIKESIARAVVQKFILGPIAAALGLAKNDGSTEAQALWVRMAKNVSPTGKDTSGKGIFGSLLGSIFGGAAGGTGTPDGSELNPFHVVDDSNGGLFGSGSSGGDGGDSGDGESSGFLGKIQGQMGKIFSAIGSFFSKIGSAILSAFKFIGGAIAGAFGGGRAVGGDIMPGKFYLVGERGPELIAPRNSGTVIPNHALGSGNRTANITNNFYMTPTHSDPFGYSQSQLANAVFTGNMRSMART